jgi:hypothetical protein
MEPVELTAHIARAMPEKRLQAYVNEALQVRKWLSYHTWSSLHSKAGFPDVVALRGDRGICAELKREGKNPKDAQVVWLDAFAAAGFETYIWRPSDWLSGAIIEVLK